ncbi:hypothetical protein TNCT_309851 [Trichonephila clavata]|uniref:Uncharacterized protein n=1 Tax=Trichonephila clavata TaxID=2740835 RepID=A0A8X6KXM1_TRICU|nr:hypothetical protein TNCT_309851 [Trichonephila clavata]
MRSKNSRAPLLIKRLRSDLPSFVKQFVCKKRGEYVVEDRRIRICSTGLFKTLCSIKIHFRISYQWAAVEVNYKRRRHGDTLQPFPKQLKEFSSCITYFDYKVV